MKVTVIIENVGGVFFVNHKRLGHDKLSDMETTALNEFIKEYKIVENERRLNEAREKYYKNELTFNQLNTVFEVCASENDLAMFWRSPVFDRPLIVEGKSKKVRDKEFNDLIQ